jgi:hypothetical protein
MPLITEVTRQRIIDALGAEGANLFGRLDDLRFLSRLYDLEALPSTDPRFETAERDIIQHRFNNDDWELNWVFEDSRFKLAHGPDETFLRFLAEMLHPVVRLDAHEVARLQAVFNEALIHDGFEIAQAGAISGAPVFAGRRLSAPSPVGTYSQDLLLTDGAPAELDDADRAEQSHALIARYGELRRDGFAGHTDQVLGLLADHFDLLGLEHQTVPSLLEDSMAVGVDLDGALFILDVVCPEQAMSTVTLERLVLAVGARQSQVSRVVLCMTGYDPAITGPLSAGKSVGCVLLDSEHLEAALSGLLSAQVVFERCLRRMLLSGMPYTSVGELLAIKTAPAPRLHTPDRVTPPWAVMDRASAHIEASVALVAGSGWQEPLGLASRQAGHLLVTVESGVLDLDVRRGTTSWLVSLPGCHGAPLPLAGGRFLVMCGSAVLEVDGAAVRIVGGAFDGSASLVPEGTGEAWVLSGAHIVSAHHERSTLALTRLGAHFGDQHRRVMTFAAAVRSAVWLGHRRFFLAGSGHSAVIDLDRSSQIDRESWIESAQHYPAHALRDKAGQVLTVSGDGSGTRVTLCRTHPGTGSAVLLADFALTKAYGIALDPQAGAYMLGDVRGNDLGPRPVLLRLTATGNLTPQMTAPTGVATIAPDILTTYAPVLAAARGQRRDYALDSKPLADGAGGQGTVFGARHKSSGIRVAFKKRNSSMPDAVARMRREIEAGKRFGANPHIMRVLDDDPNAEWFVMALAEETAETLAEEFQSSNALRDVVDAVCAALLSAHGQDWVHRDIKPANILKLEGRWVLADWGLGRRPRGQTTQPDRTKVGVLYGTEGFAAPELSVDAHAADARSDIYSLGQFIGWALTRRMPQANVPLLPGSGPWRHVVKAATQLDPERRPSNIVEFMALIRRELDPAPEIPANTAEQLRDKITAGQRDALDELLDLAVRHPDDFELYVDIVASIDHLILVPAILASPLRGLELVTAMARQDDAIESNSMPFGKVDMVMRCMLAIAGGAQGEEQWDVFEEAASGLLVWDGRWDRFGMQDLIGPWLQGLTGEAAAILATLLARHKDSAEHFTYLEGERRADHRIRHALQNHQAMKDA